MTDMARALKVVDGCGLPAEVREALRPGEAVAHPDGHELRLPRYFFEVRTWEEAVEARLSRYFGAFEFLDVDLREADAVAGFPRYLPYGVVAFASTLDRLREALGEPMRIAANGGYRSPSHALSSDTSPHLWGAAADIYRIGSEYMDDPARIERYGRMARETIPGLWVRPAGDEPGLAFDHLHIDLGYLTAVPRSEHLESAP